MPISEQLPIEKIIRQDRRTVSIQVTDNATIIIKAPRHVSDRDIEQVLVQHIKWIKGRLTRARERLKWTQRKFAQGEKFLYLGQLYELKLTDKSKSALTLKDKYFLLNKNYQSRAREIFEKWYRRQASENFFARARIYAPLLGVYFNQLKLSNARTRWGSCSSNGNINIVWRLIMAPQWIIDYVIVHELAHLRHMNHSPSFWRLVEAVFPEHKQARQWLKKYGHYLNL